MFSASYVRIRPSSNRSASVVSKSQPYTISLYLNSTVLRPVGCTALDTVLKGLIAEFNQTQLDRMVPTFEGL